MSRRIAVACTSLLVIAGCGAELIQHPFIPTGGADAGDAGDVTEPSDAGDGGDPADAGDSGDAGDAPDAGSTCDPAACESLQCDGAACVPMSEVHPRLWLTPKSAAALRTRISVGDQAYSATLAPLASEFVDQMDDPPSGTPGNRLPDSDLGSTEWTQYPIEPAAQLFAFLSQVAPSQEQRDDYGARAKTLLLYLVDKAALGVRDGEPFRSGHFSTGGRMQFGGESLPLTVDWIHDRLSVDELARVRKVFLRWGREIANTSYAPFKTASDRQLRNDTRLLDLGDEKRFRLRDSLLSASTWRLRTLALFGLSLDAADDRDDPTIADDGDGAVHVLEDEALGAWLYVFDAALRNDAVGGLPAEGVTALNDSLAPVLETLLAVHTAGLDDDDTVARLGPGLRFSGQPFWPAAVEAWLQSMPPKATTLQDLGRVYQPMVFGPSGDDYLEDPSRAFGPLALLATANGDTTTTERIRWLLREVPPGGPGTYTARQRLTSTLAIYTFLREARGLQSPVDPRPSLPRTFIADGPGVILSRTDATEDARFFGFRLGWVGNGQQGDGLGFAIFRKGDWLTAPRLGGSYLAAGSDYKNSLAIVTSAADSTQLGEIGGLLGSRGSQFTFSAAPDPSPPAWSERDGVSVVTGDAAKLYQYVTSTSQLTDVQEARRTMVWLKPDRWVVFDRLRASGGARPRRFWMNTGGDTSIAGHVTTAHSAHGQLLVLTTLAPSDATVTLVTSDDELFARQMEWSFANYDPMFFPYRSSTGTFAKGARRVMVESVASDVRFLHVLEALDAGGTPVTPTLVAQSQGDAMSGAVVAEKAVLFVDVVGAAPSGFAATLPPQVTGVLVAGLPGGSSWTVTTIDGGTELALTVSPGGALVADAAGTIIAPTH